MEDLPPGFRFHPTDEELVTSYLVRKASDATFVSIAIADIDLTKCEPWDLPGKASMGEKEWYFFSRRDRKYPTGIRTNRATDAGYWKTTGKDKEILHSGVLVGMKKTLVFYKGRAPKGEKTCWVAHEYRLHNYLNDPTKDEWVVCRVFRKTAAVCRRISTCQQQRSPTLPSMESPIDSTSFNELGEIDVSYLSNLSNNTTISANFQERFQDSSYSDHKVDHMRMHMNWMLSSEAIVSQSTPLLRWTPAAAPQYLEPLPASDCQQPCNVASRSPFAAEPKHATIFRNAEN